MVKKYRKNRLILLYEELFKKYGPQYWWPGESKFEIVVGALLTQNTNWQNVEKAINNLKEANLLTPQKIYRLPLEKLKEFIRPAGFYNQKSIYLKNTIEFFFKNGCKNFENFHIEEPDKFRKEFLKVKGIGKETCDSILLYAFNIPIFVVDSYTKRFILYYKLPVKNLTYNSIQHYFHSNLPVNHELFNEYHALIVRWGKEHSKMKLKE